MKVDVRPYPTTNSRKQEEENLIRKINKYQEKKLKRKAEDQSLNHLVERVEKGCEETKQLLQEVIKNEEKSLARRKNLLQDVRVAQQQTEENFALISRMEKQTQHMIQQVDRLEQTQEKMDQLFLSAEQNLSCVFKKQTELIQQEQKETQISDKEVDQEAICPLPHSWSVFTFVSSFFSQRIAHYASVAMIIRTQSLFWMTIKLIENPTGWITAHVWSLVADTTNHPVTWVTVGIVCYVFPVARLVIGGVAFYTLTHYATLKSRQLENEVE